jgi:hypothetical protein
MTIVRQIELAEMSPIQDVAIDDHSGNLLVCSQAAITLLSANGEMLARGIPRQSGRNGDAVTRCAISPVPDWSDEQMFVTGQKDGSFMLWAVDSHRSAAHACVWVCVVLSWLILIACASCARVRACIACVHTCTCASFADPPPPTHTHTGTTLGATASGVETLSRCARWLLSMPTVLHP